MRKYEQIQTTVEEEEGYSNDGRGERKPRDLAFLFILLEGPCLSVGREGKESLRMEEFEEPEDSKIEYGARTFRRVKETESGLLFNPTTAYEADSFVLFCFVLFAGGKGILLLLFSSSESQLQKGRPDGFR